MKNKEVNAREKFRVRPATIISKFFSTTERKKMENFMNAFKSSAMAFAKEEDGAQVIEYALIIAVVSIVLVLGLQGLNGGFGQFITRVTNCLTGAACSATAPATGG